jgi:hypothetical protein
MRCLVPLLVIAITPTGLAAQNATDTAAAPVAPKRTVEFSGLVLVNAFFTNAGVNNSDVPQFATADTLGVSGSGGTIRQTRVGVRLTDPTVLGGSFSGELDADFFGGQQPSEGARTFPLLRIRRAVGTVRWSHVALLFGQESPLVAGTSPRSLASVGLPDFADAGNLWLWLPQGRVTIEAGYSLRLALQAAVLAPTTGAAQTGFVTQLDSAERTKRPALEGRLRLAWGPSDDPGEIAVGAHLSWIKGLDSTTGDTLLVSKAITADTRFRIGFAEVIVEAYTGQALAGLGGGGIGQNQGRNGVPVRTTGGWGQLNLRPIRHLMFGGGCGIDDPDDRDLPPTGLLRNLVCEGHVEWRPPGPLVFGFEYRRLTTSYLGGDFTASHLNLAAGYRL